MRAAVVGAVVLAIGCSSDAPPGSPAVDAATACCPITYTGACNCFQVGGHRTESGLCESLCDVEPPKLQRIDDNGCPKYVATSLGSCYPPAWQRDTGPWETSAVADASPESAASD